MTATRVAPHRIRRFAWTKKLSMEIARASAAIAKSGEIDDYDRANLAGLANRLLKAIRWYKQLDDHSDRRRVQEKSSAFARFAMAEVSDQTEIPAYLGKIANGLLGLARTGQIEADAAKTLKAQLNQMGNFFEQDGWRE
ncbi:MAG TPA: hypothetical protein VLE72_01865 [Candidatus Saccharimonadales bacterium]|nr:hypothetical protein [Candidatus Saccharimonadales bacterium]